MVDISEMWFYKMFGQDFGPVTFDELKDLAEFGTISHDDEVCQGDSGNWLRAGAVPELNLDGVPRVAALGDVAERESSFTATTAEMGLKETIPRLVEFQASETQSDVVTAMAAPIVEMPTESTSSPSTKTEPWTPASPVTSATPAAVASPVPATPATSASPTATTIASLKPKEDATASESSTKLYKPISESDERQGSREDFKSVAPQLEKINGSGPAVTSSAPASSPPLVAVPPGPTTFVFTEGELAWIKALAAHEATARVARHLIDWAFSPNYSPQWWAVIGGAEHGPVDFGKIFEWVVSGRMQPVEFVRNGVYGQYGPVGSLPSVFSAAMIMKLADGEFTQAKAKATRRGVDIQAVSVVLALIDPPPATAAAATPAVAAPHVAVPSVVVAASTPEASKTQPAAAVVPGAQKSESTAPPTPLPMPAMANPEPRSSSASSAPQSSEGAISSTARSSPKPYSQGGTGRPKPRPARAAKKSSSRDDAFTDLLERLKAYRTYIAIAAAALLLIIIGWNALPESSTADVKRYQELKKILTEVRELRSKNSTNFTEVKRKAVKIGSETVKALERQNNTKVPAKKFLLQAARDELPHVIYGNLKIETQAEKNLEARLVDIAKSLGIK